MPATPFYEIPAAPEQISGPDVLARLIDGLGFRFRWATEGLRPEDWAAKPRKEHMTLAELNKHIHGLVSWTETILFSGKVEKSDPHSPEEIRLDALMRMKHISEGLKTEASIDLDAIRIERPQNPEPLPFWNLINGPIADALTHVGQMNAWRRLSGNPPIKANVFLGQPPQHS